MKKILIIIHLFVLPLCLFSSLLNAKPENKKHTITTETTVQKNKQQCNKSFSRSKYREHNKISQNKKLNHSYEQRALNTRIGHYPSKNKLTC